jgi:prepilin-type N-terminal cleavage/methylation domain-containing protein
MSCLCKRSAIKRQGRKGFSLLEVLIAFSILVMGVSFMYSIFPLGMRMIKQTQNLSSICFFAQKKIEELKTIKEPLTNSSGQENIFNWTVQVTDYTTPENIILKKIQLEVVWIEGESQRKKIFATYFK